MIEPQPRTPAADAENAPQPETPESLSSKFEELILILDEARARLDANPMSKEFLVRLITPLLSRFASDSNMVGKMAVEMKGFNLLRTFFAYEEKLFALKDALEIDEEETDDGSLEDVELAGDERISAKKRLKAIVRNAYSKGRVPLDNLFDKYVGSPRRKVGETIEKVIEKTTPLVDRVIIYLNELFPGLPWVRVEEEESENEDAGAAQPTDEQTEGTTPDEALAVVLPEMDESKPLNERIKLRLGRIFERAVAEINANKALIAPLTDPTSFQNRGIETRIVGIVSALDDPEKSKNDELLTRIWNNFVGNSGGTEKFGSLEEKIEERLVKDFFTLNSLVKNHGRKDILEVLLKIRDFEKSTS